jgi:elongation factor G
MSSENLRNIGVAAHIDAGKTTLTERILFYSGKVHRMGEVDDGSATMDWMQQERERGITITAAATTTIWRDHQINVIDTPGHVDFTVEVQRALRALDGMIAVFCAVGGVEPQSETVWRQANLYSVPRIAFINKMDRTGADFDSVIMSLRETLGARAYPVEIPVGSGQEFKGVIDLIEMKMFIYDDQSYGKEFAITDIPDEYFETARCARWELLDDLSLDNEELLTMLLSEIDPDPEFLRSSIRQAVIRHKFVPVLCGSALRNTGVQKVLDAIVDFLPSPIDLGIIRGKDPDTNDEVSLKPDSSENLSALVFKIAVDKFVGRLSFVRVYSGELDVKQSFYNPRTGKQERPSKIFRMHLTKGLNNPSLELVK